MDIPTTTETTDLLEEEALECLNTSSECENGEEELEQNHEEVGKYFKIK